MSIKDKQELWHKKLGHVNMKRISKISSKILVRGLSKINYEKSKPCNTCSLGKQVKSLFKSIKIIINNRALQLLHTDLFGPTKNAIRAGKRYRLVVIGDCSRNMQVVFLAHKEDAFY